MLNEEEPTFFIRNKNYSEILDLVLCTNNLANKVSGIKVLSDWTMGSDHAPIICSFALNKPPIQQNEEKILRFNLSQTDWGRFREELDKNIGNLDIDSFSEVAFTNETFIRVVTQAAEASIPKFVLKSNKSLPPHIINLIKLRSTIRKNIRKASFEEKMVSLPSTTN